MLGPSGSGKTTCLRLIAGFEQPGAGHIESSARRSKACRPIGARSIPCSRTMRCSRIFESATMSPTGRGSAASAKCGARQAGPRGAGHGEARRHGEPPPGTAFRRSAPARRTRPRPRRPSQGAAARRAVGRAGPQAARRDAARAEGPATRARPQLCLRHPRSGRSPVDGRPRRGVQRRPNRAGRPSGRSL